MDLSSLIPPIIPHMIPIFNINAFQSLITSLMGTILFIFCILIYYWFKKRYPYTYGVQAVDVMVETVYETLAEIGGENVGRKALVFTTTIFFYVLRHNLFGLIGDMVVLVWPAAHHIFRPVTTDIMFNGLLAITAVLWSVAYGFSLHGSHHIAKYFPINGMGIVEKVTHRYDYIFKFFDIILWLLIGFIEFVGEFGRMMSLSLRLFWNMFVWMILLSLLLYATKSFVTYPILWPIVVFAYEFCVAILQAFIFSLLTTVYFKLSADHH